MRIVIDTTKFTNSLRNLRTKFREARLDAAAKRRIKQAQRDAEINVRAAAMLDEQGINIFEMKSEAPKGRGTSRNKPAAQPARKRSPSTAR